VQGKAELVNELAALLQDFYRDKMAAMLAHEAGARLVAQYDQNNTYQYIINREEAHLAWVGKAIAELGGTLPEEPREPTRSGKGKAAEVAHHVFEDDAAAAQAFVERWRPRIDQMTNARHAKMLRVILGEVLEQKRFFEQAQAGRTDLLGRRADVLGPSHGDVLPSRWIE
jgi:Mn-containing catalase